jgi:hypothetical protein
MSQPTRVALLMIRAWCEDGSMQPLRAEIRVAEDVASGLRPTETFVDADAVIAAVRDFLDGAGCQKHGLPITSSHAPVTVDGAGLRPSPSKSWLDGDSSR